MNFYRTEQYISSYIYFKSYTPSIHSPYILYRATYFHTAYLYSPISFHTVSFSTPSYTFSFTSISPTLIVLPDSYIFYISLPTQLHFFPLLSLCTYSYISLSPCTQDLSYSVSLSLSPVKPLNKYTSNFQGHTEILE